MAILLRVLPQELEKPPDKRLQWLFWFDADTVLMNPNMPLGTFLPPSNLPEIHLLLSKDWNGLNNGVVFIRVHPWSVKFLSAAIAYPITKPKVNLFWHEQSAMSKLLEENNSFARSVVYCPLRWFNAYMRTENLESLNPNSPPHLQLHPGDLLVHFPGTQRKDLSERLGPYIAIANEHREIWEPRLENTSYIKETESFWKNVQPSPPIDK